MPIGPDTDRQGSDRPERSGIVAATTPEQISAFQAAATRGALKLAVLGIPHSRPKQVQDSAHYVLGLEPGTHKGRGANKALLDLMNTHMSENYDL
jgi:hypothetical protein